MAKYIVTGGAGFIGSHIVEYLLNSGHEVVVIDNLVTGFEEYLPDHANLKFLKLDISDWNSLSRNFAYLKGAEGVFHLAAVARIQPSIFDPSLTHDSNVTGTFNILEMMRMCDIHNIIYSASSSYYGKKQIVPFREDDSHDCQTPYAIAKYMGELYCETWSKLHKINSIRLRYFNVYGPRSPLEGQYAPVIGLFFRQAFNHKPITVVGDGEQRRDFTYIDDVVQANVKAMALIENRDSLGYHNVFNIGTGVNYSMNDLARMVRDEVARYFTAMGPVDIVHIPERIGEAKLSLADNKKAKELLGWEPKVSLQESVRILGNYYKKHLLYKLL